MVMVIDKLSINMLTNMNVYINNDLKIIIINAV